MSTSLATKRVLTNRAAIWLIVAAGMLLVIGANAHLLYVAVTSQPGCVAHLRAGEGDAEGKSFSAAQSDCSPQQQHDSAE